MSDQEKRLAIKSLRKIAQEQDKESFRDFYHIFAGRLHSYLLGLTKSQEEADDLLQEVMMTIWQKAHQYDPDKASPSTWSFVIARNKFIDKTRKQKYIEIDLPEHDLRTSEELNGEEIVEERQTVNQVRQAIEALPEKTKGLIQKSFMEDKTHEEIAKEMNIPLGTVKSRIRAAYQKMRKMLEDNDSRFI